MGQALYRTYRPLKLSEVVGQEHVTTALMHTLKAGTLSHAYLFTGPRGVGKTSIARILAHEINGLPYDDERLHLDIIEIDAASNRRIDEIRDLRDKVHIAPTSAKYKVYIIDEVHMLTREAFNALLKTLEEPPAHAVFILATTEAHKLPETIISRTQRYTFKPVPLPKVAEHLQHIAEQEGIAVEPVALELIAQHGEGSFRDSISLLDQVRNTGSAVTLAGVQAALGIAPAATIENLYKSWSQQNAPAIAQSLRQAKEQGYEATRLAKQLGESIRASLLDGNAVFHAQAQALEVLAKLIQVPASLDPHAFLEVALLDTALTKNATAAIGPAQPASPATTPSPLPPPPAQPKPATAVPTPKKPEKSSTPESTEATAKKEPAQAGDNKANLVVDNKLWPQDLEQIKQNYNTLYSILKTAQVVVEPDVIRLKFSHAFHQKRGQDAKNRQIVAETVQAVSGKNMQIKYEVAGKSEPEAKQVEATVVAAMPAVTQTANPTPRPISPSIDTISNIFGGAELLES